MRIFKRRVVNVVTTANKWRGRAVPPTAHLDTLEFLIEGQERGQQVALGAMEQKRLWTRDAVAPTQNSPHNIGGEADLHLWAYFGAQKARGHCGDLEGEERSRA
jgi:hypothetical protein